MWGRECIFKGGGKGIKEGIVNIEASHRQTCVLWKMSHEREGAPEERSQSSIEPCELNFMDLLVSRFSGSISAMEG